MSADRLAASAVHRPAAGDVGIIAVALTAVSTSGPLMAACAAPALAIAFWRNALASGLLLPWAWLRCRAELRALDRREWRLGLVAGVFLAAHFATWVPSLTFTSVASATALVATQPIWSASIARLQGAHVPRRAWLGIALAVAGAALLTGVDFSLSGRALLGDGLAVAGGMFAAGYTAAGGEARRSLSTTTYTAICYSTASLLLLAACLVGHRSLVGYSAMTWAQLAALTVGAQLLGHSLFNRVLRTTSATVVSLTILLEVPGAALLAAVFLGQRPHLAALPAAVLLIAGIALVVGSGSDRDAPVEVLAD
jgi:drug/metabolite transporter (DMT)-like permease